MLQWRVDDAVEGYRKYLAATEMDPRSLAARQLAREKIRILSHGRGTPGP